MIKHQKPSTVIISDSVAKGLCRYKNDFKRYFGKHNVKLAIGRDTVEDVVWLIRNLNPTKYVRYIVIICGTNEINKNVPEDIIKASSTQSSKLNVKSTTVKYEKHNEASFREILFPSSDNVNDYVTHT